MALHSVTRRKLTRLLAMVSVIEVILIAGIWLIDPGRGAILDSDVDGPAAPSPAIRLSVPKALKSFSASADRPIFAASRRPAPAGLKAKGPAIREKGAILGRYRLTGVVVTSSVKIAFLKDMRGNRNFALKIGEKLENWVFEDIKKDSITLVSGTRREVFKLRKLKNR